MSHTLGGFQSNSDMMMLMLILEPFARRLSSFLRIKDNDVSRNVPVPTAPGQGTISSKWPQRCSLPTVIRRTHRQPAHAMKRHRAFDVSLPVAAIESDDGSKTAASSGGITIVVHCRVLFRNEPAAPHLFMFGFCTLAPFQRVLRPPLSYGCCIDIGLDLPEATC